MSDVVASQQQINSVLALRAGAKAAGDMKAYKQYDDAYKAILKGNEDAKKKSVSNQISSNQAKFDANAFFNDPNKITYIDSNGKTIDLSKQVTATGGDVTKSTVVTDLNKFNAVGSASDIDKYTLVPTKQGGQVLAEKDAQGNILPGPRAIYVNPDDPSQYSIGTVSQVMQKIIADYRKQPDGIKNLKRQLVGIKALTKAKASNTNDVDDALTKALLKTVTSHSVQQWNDYSTNKFANSQFTPFQTALAGGENLTSTGTTVTRTSIPMATAEATNFIKTMTGLNLDSKVASAYANELRALEGKRPGKSVTTRDPLTGSTYTTSEGGGITPEEKSKLLFKVLNKVVKNTPYDVLVKNGGKAIQDANSLVQYAAAYGYKISTKDAVDRTIGALASGGDINAEKEKIKQATIARYGHLAKAIEAGSTLKDIANQYTYYKSQLMETPQENITLDDPDIQAALDNNGKLMSTNDFQIRIRKNPLWAKTRNAREEAAGYANSILKSFGLSA